MERNGNVSGCATGLDSAGLYPTRSERDHNDSGHDDAVRNVPDHGQRNGRKCGDGRDHKSQSDSGDPGSATNFHASCIVALICCESENCTFSQVRHQTVGNVTRSRENI